MLDTYMAAGMEGRQKPETPTPTISGLIDSTPVLFLLRRIHSKEGTIRLVGNKGRQCAQDDGRDEKEPDLLYRQHQLDVRKWRQC